MAEGAAPPPEQVVEELGGYDCDFVEPVPDRLQCMICQCPSKDPHLSVCCGNLFCKSCLDKAKESKSVEQVCPCCRNAEFLNVPNKQAQREIRSFAVFCDNKHKGCEWSGELNYLINHRQTNCLYQPIQCPNKCGEMSERRFMASHVETKCSHRIVKCEYCGTTGEYRLMEAEHREKCPKALIPCPNKCSIKGIPREDMEAHINECPLGMVQCEYHNVGCEERMMRKDLEKHMVESMNKHLRLTLHQVNIQERHIDNLTHTVSESKKELIAAKDELFRSRNEKVAADKELASAIKELKDARNLVIDLNTKLATQEQHLTVLQRKLQDDVKELKAYGEAVKQKVDGYVEAELQKTRQELMTAKKEMTTVKHDLKTLTQAEMKVYLDGQYQKIRADVDKDLSANKQRLQVLTQQYNATKVELDIITKTTQGFGVKVNSTEQNLHILDTKLQTATRDLQKLNNEQAQISNDLAASRHDIEGLKGATRKMNEAINVDALQREFRREVEKLKDHVHQMYTPQEKFEEIERQLGIIPNQYNHLPWTRGLYFRAITGEEMCPVIVKVPKYESKKRLEIKWCSHGFYTHNRGYKMCLRVIASGAGSGKGTHLSVFLYLMKSPYDGQLDWPLKGEFEMTLLNQVMDGEHRLNTVKFSEKTPSAIANKVKSGEMAADGLGRNEFISENDLVMVTPTCQYLKDDCIFIRVSRKLG